ncbi:MAG: sugar phosphate isomerase/epimerase, partial [Cytophagales bacterium]|nr:sugar phosphate isomerase/epimerase [Cytophagales bacterium]
MYLSISSYTFPWAVGVAGHEPAKPLIATDLLALATRHGAAGVQFGDNLPLHLLTDSELGQLVAEARQRNVRLETGTRRLTTDNLRRYLAIAQRLGSPFLRVVIDDADYHPDEAQVIDVIQSVLDGFRAAGVMLAIENHDRFPVDSLRRIIE